MKTTYTLKARHTALVWEFAYDLHGNLLSFTTEGVLTADQAKWLFSHRFPYNQKAMELFAKLYRKNFELTIGKPDLSFNAFYNEYGYKVKKVPAQKAWDRLSKKDKIDALAGIKAYKGYLHRKQVAQAMPTTYINQRYWESNWNSVH